MNALTWDFRFYDRDKPGRGGGQVAASPSPPPLHATACLGYKLPVEPPRGLNPTELLSL